MDGRRGMGNGKWEMRDGSTRRDFLRMNVGSEVECLRGVTQPSPEGVKSNLG